LALLQFAYRGYERVHSEVPLWDFASVYAAAQTWLHGGDPYSIDQVVQTWHDCRLFADRDVSYFATVYPPNSLAMILPFALLPAGVAMILWLAITLALVAAQFAALADLAGLRWRDHRVLILVAASLASAAFQFGILSGQLSQVAIAMSILSLWCALRRREWTGGVLLGLAAALKPQIAAPLVVYFALTRRWTAAALSIGLAGFAAVGAIVAMHLTHVDWWAGWTQSIALTQQIGGVNDYGWTGPYRDEIMDLKLLLVSFIHDPRLLKLTVEGITLLLAAVYLRVFQWTPRDDRQELLLFAGLAAISFLPIYHRVYDAALLTTAFVWALAELDGQIRYLARGILIPMALFLVPFDVTETVGRRVHLLGRLSQTAGWQSFIAPHYAWGLLLVTVAMLAALSRTRTVESIIHSARRSSATSRKAPPAPMLQGN
jgi:hypothetical protein